MVDIINYIRNFIFPSSDNRKRRAPLDDYEVPINSKVRRVNSSALMTSNNEEDWHSISSSDSLRRRSILQSSSGVTKSSRPSWSKENITILGDDDDILEVSKPKQKFGGDSLKAKPFHFAASTPNNIVPRCSQLQNGDDDVVFLKTNTPSISDKKKNSLKRSMEYIKPYQNGNCSKDETYQNGTQVSDYEMSILKRAREIKAKCSINNRPAIRSNTLDQSFRLEEKAKYKKLLSQAAPSASSGFRESFSKYNPTTLFVGNGSRGKRLVELSLRTDKAKKKTNFIDLTSENSAKVVSTKDRIKRVLNNFDNNELIVIKDSDSDLEILPTPPSPKPDIQVDRVNSLKTVVDSSQSTHTEWLQQLVQKYRNEVSKSVQEIRTHSDLKEKLSVVTSQVCTQRLEDQMVRCLQIKDAILPVQVEKTSFPPISEEDQARINSAFSNRANPSEVLAHKFNLSITRRDLQTLAGLSWLNDEVINFYMNLIMERGNLLKWPNVYAMNTFFYPKLLKDGHSSLKRWTRRVDLFSYDIIVIPIHLRVHWCMSIIDFRSKTIRYYDSMGGANRQCLEALLKYLRDEHLDKKKTEYKVSDWSLESMADIPQQMNGSDCGMFACTFAEFISRNAAITFSQENMPYLRRKMVLEILRGELLFT